MSSIFFYRKCEKKDWMRSKIYYAEPCAELVSVLFQGLRNQMLKLIQHDKVGCQKKGSAVAEPFFTGKNILLNVPTFLLYDNHLP